jgi:hypothetical protein
MRWMHSSPGAGTSSHLAGELFKVMAGIDMVMEPMSADEIAELYAADAEKYAKIIREAGIKLAD